MCLLIFNKSSKIILITITKKSLSHDEIFILLIDWLRQRSPWRYWTWQVMKLHSWSRLNILYVLEYCFPNIVHFIRSITILNSFDRKMNLLVEGITREVGVVFWDIIVNLDTKTYPCLVGPAARYIFNCVPSSPNHYCRQSKSKHQI